MKDSPPNLAIDLGSLDPNDPEFISDLGALLAGSKIDGDPSGVFKAAFQLFERGSNADFGCPGPLVHFLESFYPAYVDQLEESVHRRPTTQTVWMVNRILNGQIDAAVRNRLLSLMASVARNHQVEEALRVEANGYLEHYRANHA